MYASHAARAVCYGGGCHATDGWSVCVVSALQYVCRASLGVVVRAPGVITSTVSGSDPAAAAAFLAGAGVDLDGAGAPLPFRKNAATPPATSRPPTISHVGGPLFEARGLGLAAGGAIGSSI